MTSTTDFKKINKSIKIFAVVQFGLVVLLVGMAILFQAQLRNDQFIRGVLATFVIQLAMFYPIYKFSSKEADRDLYLNGTNLTKDEVKVFTKKKRYADIIKTSTFGFFIIFLLVVPRVPMVLSIIYYSFILTILTYLQTYNFAAKKLMARGK